MGDRAGPGQEPVRVNKSGTSHPGAGEPEACAGSLGQEAPPEEGEVTSAQRPGLEPQSRPRERWEGRAFSAGLGREEGSAGREQSLQGRGWPGDGPSQLEVLPPSRV